MKRKIISLLIVFSLCLAYLNVNVVNVYASISNSTYTATIGSQTIPFADYPVGSYFTDNGSACNDHSSCGSGSWRNDTCNCKSTWNGVALNSTSCYGFANMVFYRLFGHTTYSQTTKVVTNISASSINSTYLYNLFTNGTVKAGAHIRNSTHSMIFMGCDSSYIYTYEGNYDGHCRVGVIRRTWAEMVTYLQSKNGIAFIQMPNSYPNTPQYVSADIPNGVYSIQWKSSNTYVSAGNTDEVGYDTFIYEPGKNGDLDLDQKFYFERLSDGTYKIISQRSGMVLEVDSLSYDNEAVIQQWTYNSIASQQWYIVYRGDGYYKFINKHSGKALDYGNHLQQWTDNNTDAQKFKIESASYTKSSELQNGLYCIKHKNGLYVSAGNTDEVGYDTTVYEPGNNGELDKDQQFYFERLENNAYKIISQRSGMVLEVDDLSYVDEAVIQQWNYNNVASQQWIIINDGQGYYKFINKNSGKALDYGNHLQQWTDNNTDAQKFEIIPMNYQITYNTNGGSGNIESQSKTYLKDISLTSIQPTRTGYTFSNWNTSSLGVGKSYSSGGLYTANSTVTLYAQWTPNTYKVAFNANSGIASTTSKNVIYNATYGTLPIPSRIGYTFKGWYTDKTGGSEITSETIVNTTSDITLYAKWESVIPYTESIVTKSGTKLIIDTKVRNITAPYDILIVGYKNNKFVAMKRVPHDEQNSPYTLEGDMDEIKIMVWNNLSTLKPLCEAEEIPISKWIME